MHPTRHTLQRTMAGGTTSTCTKSASRTTASCRQRGSLSSATTPSIRGIKRSCPSLCDSLPLHVLRHTEIDRFRLLLCHRYITILVQDLGLLTETINDGYDDDYADAYALVRVSACHRSIFIRRTRESDSHDITCKSLRPRAM